MCFDLRLASLCANVFFSFALNPFKSKSIVINYIILKLPSIHQLGTAARLSRLSAEDGSYVDGVGKIFVAFSERVQ